MTNIALIGVGVSGLSFLSFINRKKFNIEIFEKSRGFSGRLSTRRTECGKFDHGAQFFTIKNNIFKEFLLSNFSELFKKYEPSIKYNNHGVLENFANSTHYYFSGGMNSFGKTLGKKFNASLNTKIKSIKKTSKNKWQLIFDDNYISKGTFDYVVSSAPFDQTRDIYSNNFSFDEKFAMKPCITLMVGFKTFHDDVYPYQKFHDNSNLDSLFYQNYKFNDNKLHCWVIQAKAQWSINNLELPDEKIISELLSKLKIIFGPEKPDFLQLHKWRFASTSKNKFENEIASNSANLFAIGDWVSGGRVEGAFISGYRLAKHFNETI